MLIPVWCCRMGEDMSNHIVHESASELAASSALVDSARSLCGCNILRESIGSIVAERSLTRRREPVKEPEDALDPVSSLYELLDAKDRKPVVVRSTKSWRPTPSSPARTGGPGSNIEDGTGSSSAVSFAPSLPRLTSEEIAREAKEMPNGQIAREVMLMHTELQSARSQLDLERSRRLAAEAELSRLRTIMRQMQITDVLSKVGVA